MIRVQKIFSPLEKKWHFSFNLGLFYNNFYSEDFRKIINLKVSAKNWAPHFHIMLQNFISYVHGGIWNFDLWVIHNQISVTKSKPDVIFRYTVQHNTRQLCVLPGNKNCFSINYWQKRIVNNVALLLQQTVVWWNTRKTGRISFSILLL